MKHPDDRGWIDCAALIGVGIGFLLALIVYTLGSAVGKAWNWVTGSAD